MKIKTAVIDFDMAWHFTVLALITAAFLLIPNAEAGAAVNSNVGDQVCAIALMFGGNAGRGIATIGISVIGVLALIGRVTWTQALIVGVGCAVLFGAYTLVLSLNAAQSAISTC